MKNKAIILILIFGFLFRVVGLSQRPAGFTWDEAALGYNAYSLLLTGKDEHGQTFPLIFKSFGDYKPGLYIYFTVLPVKLFGLSEFSTRLTSSIFGVLSILLIYLVTRKIFNQKIALPSAFLLSINPAMIHFSRAAWESNLNLFLLLLITNLFISKKYYLVTLFSGLSFYTYQGAKLNTPFLLLVLFFVLKPKLKDLKYSILCLLMLAMPVMLAMPSQSGRLKVFSVFSYTRSPDYVQSLISQDPNNLQSIYKILFHSETYDQLRGITQRFLNHLSPRYLFSEGNWTDRRQTPAVYYGNFHLFEFITILLGIYLLTKKNIKLLYILITITIGFIIPSALSRDIITTVRSLPLIIPLTILSAVGLSKIISSHKLLASITIVYLLFSIVYFTDLYFRHTPHFYSKDWLFPYKQAISIVSKYQSEYTQIHFTDKLGQPYIYFLFYQVYPPSIYQNQNSFTSNPNGDVGQVLSLGKISFEKIYWPSLRHQKNILVIGDEFELPEKDLNIPGLVKYGDINYPDGQIGLRIVGIPMYYAQK